jgi:predicted DNA-binding transcriptional regulator AlpA
LKKLYDFIIKEKITSTLTVRELSQKIGMSEPEIWRYLSLLNLVPEVQEMVLFFCRFA